MNRPEMDKFQKAIKTYKTKFFMITLFVIACIALIIPLRPTFSIVEKRKLEKFPEFSANSFLDGSYFAKIDSWYSDTFPFRETLVSADTYVARLSGIRTQSVHGDVTAGDEIPNIENMSDQKESASKSDTSVTVTENKKQKEAGAESSNSVLTSENNDCKKEQNLNVQSLGAIFIAGDSAYEYYGFNKDAADKYSQLISTEASNLKKTANVYDILIPNSMDIILKESLRENLNTSNQQEAIKYMYGIMNENVKKIEIYNTLKSHSDEYIYFRTDHHWTALGAYYAYCKFAEEKGIQINKLSQYKEITFDNFLGSFYTDTKKLPQLESNPDVITAYIPKSTNNITFTDRSGQEVNWNIIYDVSDYNSAVKYSTFIGGDNPISVINNPKIKDKSSCVVVKESYGNAFVPFLVDNYQTVYIIDYRYYNGTVDDFVKENHVKDVIFLNNIVAANTSERIEELSAVIKQ